MKKKILRIALVAVLLVGMLGGIGASPASAAHTATDLCVIAAGTATLVGLSNTPPAPGGLWALGLGPAVSSMATNGAGTDSSVTGGLCAIGLYTGATPAVTGHTVHASSAGITGTTADPYVHVGVHTTGKGTGGWCGHSTGTVTVTAGAVGHTGLWISAGTLLVITGPGVNGAVSALVDATAATNSCLSGTARIFLVTGLVSLT